MQLKGKDGKPVKVTLGDGNAFVVLGACRKAARRAGVADEQIEAFMEEAKSGDYDHLLYCVNVAFDVSF